MSGKLENLSMAMEDKIHQPYRSKLIPNMEQIFEQAKTHGALAAYLSGAGSTLMAMIEGANAEAFQKEMTTYLQTLPDDRELTLLKADVAGARVEIE